MILGTGIDIVDNRRIKKIIDKFDYQFKNRCFSKDEINISEKKYNKINSFAKKYAAKEACAKALGTGFFRGISWKDIEVLNNDFGKPLIKLHNKALTTLELITKDYKIDVSLSDEKNYSIASVVIYNNEK